MKTIQYLSKYHRFLKHQRRLYGDTLLFLRWESKNYLRMEFRSYRFAQTKNMMFAQHYELCSSIQPLIMRKDKTGILATALVGVDGGYSSFLSGGLHYSSERLVEIIDMIKSPEALRMVLFGGELTFFLASIENIWVYLYLSASMGMSTSDIADDLNAILKSDFEGISKWRLKGGPTEEVIHYFLEEHEQVLHSANTS